MPDRIVKPDSGNDLVLQNDDASAKIEINEGGNIVLTPSGTEKITVGNSSNPASLTSNGFNNLLLDTNSGTNSGTILITHGANQNIDITPHGTGEVNITKVDIDAGNISGTDIDVSSGTFTTSTAQKQAIVDGATIEAQDLASGSGTSLPNNVQDAITRLGTVTNGTFNSSIGTSATFPAGIIIKRHLLEYGQPSSSVSTSNTSYTDSGIASSFTTKKSSSDSFLIFHFKSAMTYYPDSGSAPQTDICLTNASNTSHSNNDSVYGSLTYKNYNRINSSTYYFGDTKEGIFKVGTRVTSNLATYSAGQTLYARIFIQSGNGSHPFYLVHEHSYYLFYVDEIAL